MNRFLLLVLVLLTVNPLFAFTTTATANVSQSAGPPRATMEPVIAAVQINGVTHGAAAYINLPNVPAQGDFAQIQVAHTTDFVNWSAPVTLPLNATNGITYTGSADPVFVQGNGWPYIDWLFCFGTMWTEKPYEGRSTIGVWHSSDGGVTWSQPDVLDAPPSPAVCAEAGPPPAGTQCIFDDKPAAVIAPPPNISGMIYVAWTRTTYNPNTTAVYMTRLIPTRGWQFIGQIGESNMNSLPGPTPAVDASTGYVYLFLMKRGANISSPTIRVFASGEGLTWSELIAGAETPAPGIEVSTVSLQTAVVKAIPFLDVKFDALYHHFYVVYHRATPGGAVTVVSRRFSPPAQAWTEPQTINTNGHTQWNPAVVQMPSGDFVLTYYDSNASETGYSLYASRVNLYGITAETTRIFAYELSNPAGYNLDAGIARIGEYQGLATLNGVLYAATLYVPQNTPQVGNAWVVRFIPGP